jgi:hypothetical protein
MGATTPSVVDLAIAIDTDLGGAREPFSISD